MTAILKVDTIQDTAGNNIINESSDTITIGASGDTTNIVGTLQNNGSALVTGKILQVVQTTLTTLLSTTSGTFVEASGFNVAITPSSTSSKVLVMVTTNTQNSAGNAGKTYITLARGSSVLQANGFVFHSTQSGASYFFSSSSAFNYLDSPSTTSATTYKVYFSGEVGTGSVNYNNSVGTITAMEVAG